MSDFGAAASPLLNMMADLAGNPEKAAQFADDPHAVMDAHGLSDDHKAKVVGAIADLKAGNTASMRTLVADATVHPDTCFFTAP